MATQAQHRVSTGLQAISRLVEDHLDRWATGVDRLKGLNAQLVEALKSVKGQFGCNAHRYGCECGGFSPPHDPCFRTRIKVLDAIKAAQAVEDAPDTWRGRPFKFPQGEGP